jgi:GNAT superfamily N-acetyltransferase
VDELRLRAAVTDDAAEVARLVTELGYPTSTAEMSDRLATILLRSDHCTIVAVTADRLLGFVGAVTGLFYEQNGTYGRIVALVVASDARRRGIGTALLAHADAGCGSRASQ